MAKLMDYMKVIDDTMIFDSELLECYVPTRYAADGVGLCKIQDFVMCFGVFECVVNKKESFGLLLPCMLHMAPSETRRAKIDDIEYIVFEFQRGDKFLTTRTALREDFLAYAMYNEFVTMGRFPKFLKYSTTAFLFDTVEKICGVNLRTPHSVFEMIYAHLARDRNDLTKKYRHTDMKELPYFLGTKNVSVALDSTSSKLLGSYFNDGLNSALLNPVENQSPLEDLLRQ